MPSAPLILHAFPNETLAPEDFKQAMDDLQSASSWPGRDRNIRPEDSARPGAQLRQLFLRFAPFDGDAA
jgi:hypothetical protein